jgi:hypothetical protein
MRTNPRTSRERAPRLSRRTFLRGVGVTMALPWLESLSGIGVSSAAAAEAGPGGPAALPQRFGVLFMGNGISPNNWSAEGEGANLQLSKTLTPLEPLKQKINVIHGLFNKTATGQGIHPAMTGQLLSGAQIRKGAIIQGGISVDQMIANHVGRDTLQPSLVLACEQPMSGYHESNFSNAYSSHISWQNPDSPMPNEVYPSLAFDSLFENGGSLRNISVLDRVKDHAARLGRKISAADKGKLDEYLSSVRDVEKSIDRMRADKATAEDRARGKPMPLLAMKRPENGLPEDLRDHTRLMCDIIALAFQMDKTRVASLLLARDLSALYYPFLGVKEPHHGASHNANADDYESISRFHIGQLAYLAKRLDEMREGEGSVLDNTCLMFISNMWTGTGHDNRKVPVVTVGGLGGTLKTGRSLNYIDAGDENRKLCSLYLGLMDRMGLEEKRFGDADTRLAGL